MEATAQSVSLIFGRDDEEVKTLFWFGLLLLLWYIIPIMHVREERTS